VDAGHGPGHGLTHEVIGHVESSPAGHIGAQPGVDVAVEALPRLGVSAPGCFDQATLLIAIQLTTWHIVN
jgi:hypothetical protein